jgi:uncharacterized protein (TIGR02246 family)
MLRRFSVLAVSAALLASGPVAAAAPEDAALNAVYARLAQARAANDVAGMSEAFSRSALLIDARPGLPVSGAELAARLRPQADRIVADGLRVETGYRIERRSVAGNVAIDAGYMRQAIVRPNAEPMIRHARFLVTLVREADGAWRIAADAAMPSTEEAWNAVVRSDGLHYDG